MKTVFTLGQEEFSNERRMLLLEVGQDYCSYGFFNDKERSFYLIKYISFDEFEITEKLAMIIDDLKKNKFEKIIICSGFTQALLMPRKYFNNDYSMLHVVYDQQLQKYLNNQIAESQMVTAYSIPEAIYRLITSAFSPVVFFHSYTTFLKVYNGFVNDQICIDFTIQQFRVLVKKDQQILLAQTYLYKTPLDVIYYLLKICSEFELHQSELYLIISGLIVGESAMYKELHHYFLNVHFAQPPSFSVPDSEYPHHFFTSLYNLAVCAS